MVRKTPWNLEADELRQAKPVFQAPYEQHGSPRIEHAEHALEALNLIVVYQQISGRVAEVLSQRIRNQFPGSLRNSQTMLETPESALRAIGLPASRIRTLHTLARSNLRGDLDLTAIAAWKDEDVRELLTNQPGLGPWSANMYLYFHLLRADVMIPSDLGARKGLGIMTGTPTPSAKQLEQAAEDWAPFRSAAMWYLWKQTPGFPEPGVR